MKAKCKRNCSQFLLAHFHIIVKINKHYFKKQCIWKRLESIMCIISIHTQQIITEKNTRSSKSKENCQNSEQMNQSVSNKKQGCTYSGRDLTMKFWRLIGFITTGGPAVLGHAWSLSSVAAPHALLVIVPGVEPTFFKKKKQTHLAYLHISLTTFVFVL